MKRNIRSMNDNIPNDIGQVADLVYNKMELDEQGGTKDLPLDEDSGWYEPLKCMAMASEGLEESIAEKRVLRKFEDNLLDYTSPGYEFTLDEDTETVTYLSIIGVAVEYRSDEHQQGQKHLPLGGQPYE